MNSMLKRILSLVMALTMVMSIVTMPAAAIGEEPTDPVPENCTESGCRLAYGHEGDHKYCETEGCNVTGAHSVCFVPCGTAGCLFAVHEGDHKFCEDADCLLRTTRQHTDHQYCTTEGCKFAAAGVHDSCFVPCTTAGCLLAKDHADSCEYCTTDGCILKGETHENCRYCNTDGCTVTGAHEADNCFVPCGTSGCLLAKDHADSCEYCTTDGCILKGETHENCRYCNTDGCTVTGVHETDDCFVPCAKSEYCALPNGHEAERCALNCGCPIVDAENIENNEHVKGCTLGLYVEPCIKTDACEAVTHEPACPKYVINSQETLLGALASEVSELTLSANVSVPGGADFTGKTVKLAGFTLTFEGDMMNCGGASFENGNIVLLADSNANEGYFLVPANTSITMDHVHVSGTGYNSYAVIRLYKGSTANITDCTFTLSNAAYKGSIINAEDGGGAGTTINLTRTGITGTNPGRGITYGNVIMQDSSVTLTGTTAGGLDNGMNRVSLVVTNSNISISGGAGRGITAEQGNIEIKGNSSVEIRDMAEATIQLRSGKTLTVDSTAKVVVDKAVSTDSAAAPTIEGTVTVDDAVVFMDGASGTAGTYDLGVDMGFTSLKAAMESEASAGKTIYVRNSYTDTAEAVLASNKSVTLDLNGKTVKIPSIVNNGNLTVTNGTLEGTDSAKALITSTSNSTLNASFTGIGLLGTIRSEGAAVNITGGHYSVNGVAGSTVNTLRAKDGSTITISGGAFAGPHGKPSDSGKTFAMEGSNTKATISGGNFSGGIQGTIYVGGGKLDITGDVTVGCEDGSALLIQGGEVGVAKGTFTGGNHAGIYLNAVSVEGGELTITGGTYDESVAGYFDPAAYKQTENSGKYTVSQKQNNVQIVTGDTAVNYETLAEAIAAADASEETVTVTVLKTHEAPADSAVAEIAAGKNIEINLNGKTVTMPGIMNYGTLNIYGGTVVGNNRNYSAVENNGENAKLKANFTAESMRHAIRADGGTVELLGGSYTVIGYPDGTSHGLNASSGAVVTIKAGTTISGSATDKANSGSDGAAIAARGSGTKITIEGGTFSKGQNDTVYVQDDALVEIKGGIFDSTNNSALNVGPNGTATISGGTFTGSNGGALTVDENGSLTITGGTFDEKPDDKYIADGYCTGKRGNNYTVAKHEMTKVSASDPTCETDGKYEHYTCTNCGKIYADAGGTTEKSLAEVTRPKLGHDYEAVARVAPSYTADGMQAHYKCKRTGCTELFVKNGTAYEKTNREDLIISKLVDPSGAVVLDPSDAHFSGGSMIVDLREAQFGIGKTSVKIPTDILEDLTGSLTVHTATGTAVFNNAALDTLLYEAECSSTSPTHDCTLTVVLTQGTETEMLSDIQKAAMKTKQLYDKSKIIRVQVLDCEGNELGGKDNGHNGLGTNGKLTVTVTKKLTGGTTSNYSAYWITDKLTAVPLSFSSTSTANTYYARLTLTHMSDYVIGRGPKYTWIPNTGDESNIGLWIGVMAAAAVALGGAGVVAIVKKKKKK